MIKIDELKFIVVKEGENIDNCRIISRARDKRQAEMLRKANASLNPQFNFIIFKRVEKLKTITIRGCKK